MIHPSYVDLMNIVNKDVEEGEAPVINSRYSIVMATAKRARQLIDGDDPLIDDADGKKPLSIAVEELEHEKIKILPRDEQEIEKSEEADLDKAMALENELETEGEPDSDADDESDETPEEAAESGEGEDVDYEKASSIMDSTPEVIDDDEDEQ
ncbi:MAG TPA: DNA-directed RNA polymerase subunit omega [Lachnospiraceae bacterium]|jgi:DNA-directed RNA polymerase subunit omega|nr:DNA-directed RNA polymerase subunit omega [Lachnospiraceae bacterium]